MRDVEQVDSVGRKSKVRIPDDAPDSHAQFGVLIGPPDLSGLELPQELEVKLNNELYNRNLLTLRDVKARPQEVQYALQATLKVDVTRILNLYAGESG